MKLPQNYIDGIINAALAEDINFIDTTTDYLISDDATCEAHYISKDNGVLCGIDVAKRVFEIMGGVTFEKKFNDGDKIKRNDIIAEFSGNTKNILKGERTALNLLQHMSGISSYTAKCVELCIGSVAKVTDTRKTLPGIRALQKYAVRVGGGYNHRFNLSDGAMLKDNHIAAHGGIKPAVMALRQKIGHMVKIEVEVTTLAELNEALAAKADIIMLDNMSVNEMTTAAQIVGDRALLEASGNITLENIRKIALTGIDILSIGALTHSVTAFDISQKIIK
ncbi:MAG: carboxylating nicotinate-nucleotide diphosphorylase [Ruminococcus sp.]|jgi:nicotinate-nucleotide pyrophosphorylase (carboxylating)|nr:carboxylating nicotinate-nucleotide diphosphorylase [Ruminococcus sp.]